MNPVTQSLLLQIQDSNLHAFAREWDALENLVIEINRQKSISFAQQKEFFDVQAPLRQSYLAVAVELEPFWRVAKINGEVLCTDPYARLIEAESARDFLENWDIMQTLPAAREAFNQTLIARIEKEDRA